MYRVFFECCKKCEVRLCAGLALSYIYSSIILYDFKYLYCTVLKLCYNLCQNGMFKIHTGEVTVYSTFVRSGWHGLMPWHVMHYGALSWIPHPAKWFCSPIIVQFIAGPMTEMLFCTNENLHFTVKLEQNPPHVMLWANDSRSFDWPVSWMDLLTPYLMQKCGMRAVNACSTTLHKSLSQ